MVYKLHKNGSYNIHTIKTDRFKNVRMEIYFRNNIDKETISTRTMLFNMLMENSKNYKTKRDITLRLEELYNARCYSTSTKVGNQILSCISLDFINPKYLNEDILESAIELPFDLIFNPNITDLEFDENTIEVIKTRLISDLLCLKENPQKLSIQNALKAMDSESVSSINLMGDTVELESITSQKLLEQYNYILKHDYIDIFIIGDIDMDLAINYINKYAKFDTIKNHELELMVDNKSRKKVNKFKEKSNFSQTQLVYILNTINLTEDERKYAFIIYNLILGGGSLETKLYRNLRDQHSLCYSATSIYQKYDNLVLIYTAIDQENTKLAISLINKTIDEMKNKITEEEVMRAKSSIISSINMALDNPTRIIDMYLFREIADLDELEERIKNFKKVTVEDVLRVANKVSINTIYTLESGESCEEN